MSLSTIKATTITTNNDQTRDYARINDYPNQQAVNCKVRDGPSQNHRNQNGDDDHSIMVKRKISEAIPNPKNHVTPVPHRHLFSDKVK